MSFLLECPHCGPRDVNEFRYQGEITRRPPPDPSLRELTDYVYFRDNVAGIIALQGPTPRFGRAAARAALPTLRDRAAVISAELGSQSV